MRRSRSEICRPERPLQKAELHIRRTERQSTDSTRRRARTAEHRSAVKIGRTGTTNATLREVLSLAGERQDFREPRRALAVALPHRPRTLA
jgi:hypothetical protein